MQELPPRTRSRLLTGATRVVRAGLDGLLSVALAPCCAACGARLECALGSVVCDRCWTSIRRLSPPFCDRCGEPLATWRVTSVERGRCPRCRRQTRLVLRVAVVGEYEGTLRAIIHAWKYDGRRSLGSDLARLLRLAGAEILASAEAAVPVPLHPWRRYSRGFNQARDLASRLDVPVLDALRRTRHTSSQVDLPSARRHANVRGAFAVTPGWMLQSRTWRITGRRLVLVDDVTTTGATLEACARVLMAAGAAEVSALTLARTVDRRR
jgi:ComF family protein